MTRKACLSCFLLILYFVQSATSTCEGPYMNVCGDFGNVSNATEIEESVETICDCQQVKLCFLVELSQECDSTVVILNPDGNFTQSQALECEILPLKSEMKTPGYEILNQTENEIIMSILTDSRFGGYKISCSFIEVFNEFNTTIDVQWEILSVNPKEVIIDSDILLQLTVVKETKMNPTSLWCFIKTPDNTTEVLSSFWTSDSEINCIGFKPVIPGVYKVSLNSLKTSNYIQLPSNLFDKAINVQVLSKPPIAQQAEYSPDLESIFVYFDDNIEMHSSCVDVFSKESLEHFGKGFSCFTRGNVLVVKMGIQFQIISNISIIAQNKICRAGSFSSELCLPSPPANLVLPKPMHLGPRLNLFTNPACGSPPSQKYMNVNVIPSKYSNYEAAENQTHQTSFGKTQRKNLIMWKLMRKIQSKFSSSLAIPQMNATEVLPLLENLSALDNTLDVDQNSLGSVSVSIFMQSSPSSTFIVAEATVTFCEGSVLHHYKWIVNGEDVFENGKLLIMEDLAPGKYLIRCLVIESNSSEILGQGWTTTEILPNKQKVIITPSEITIGTADNITFHAVTWPGNSVSWTCKTSLNKLCTTNNQKLASEVLDLTSSTISIPGETFPAGDYVWTAENVQEANTAKLFISPGNRISVGVETSTIFVKPFEEVVLRGIVKRANSNCKAWWSSVRQKGFSYLNLENMREKEEVSIGEIPIDEINLVIPPSSSNWKGLEPDSSYMFKLQAFCPQNPNNQNGSLDYIKVPLIVNNVPDVSPLIVEPLEGFAMITNFKVYGGETNVSYPSVFEWSYVDSCDEETPIKHGAFSRNFTTYLPPGDIRLKLKVCNGKEVCSTTTTDTVSVVQKSEFPAENFQNARKQIQFLMTSGDILEAFGLATTVFKSLALIRETEFREMIFSTVEEGIKAKIKELMGRIQTDSKAVKLSLEFFERAVTVAKYFRKGSNILNELTEFKDRVLRISNPKKIFLN